MFTVNTNEQDGSTTDDDEQSIVLFMLLSDKILDKNFK